MLAEAAATRGTCLEAHDALPTIPNKRNRGDPRPWAEAMAETHKQRNRIERAFGKAKHFRRFAARYEKLRDVDRGLVRLVFGFIHVRKLARTVNRTKRRAQPAS